MVKRQHAAEAIVTSALVTTLPSTKPPIVGTASPSELPIINTNFCGTSWEDHTQDCTLNKPCPGGDECGLGESCFTGSDCTAILNGDQEDVEAGSEEESKVGHFCGSIQNLLLSMVST